MTQLLSVLYSPSVFHSYTCTVCHKLTEHTPEGLFLFNQKAYLRHQPVEDLISFRLDYQPESRLVALLHVFVQDNSAVSPWRATFGGIECLENIPEEIITFFLREIDSFFRQHGIRFVQIVSMPQGYAPPAMEALPMLLLQHEYTVFVEDTNYHIPISTPTLLSRMHASERRRVRKCQHAGMYFTELIQPNLMVVYQFIYQARLRKQFPMTMSYTDFMQLFERMPDTYRIFAVYHQDNLAALTVTVNLSSTVLYNFYPADHDAYLSYSPAVFLLASLYQKAYQEGYKVLDLGIATEKGIPNEGLMRFKKNLGGEPSPRFTFLKETPH